MPIPIRHPSPLSSHQGRRKIIRNLLQKLKQDQACDVPLPSPSILEIKFYIKNNTRYRNIVVKDNIIPSPIPPTFLDHIPRFVASQLEAQRIADINRQSVQLSAVLVFLSEYLATDPTRIASVPTVFIWHEKQRRRTYCLFGYLTRAMEPRHYSAAELLSLRGSQASETSHELLTKLKSDPEIDEVVSKDRNNATQAQTRASKKPQTNSSSSNESDEIIFQGKKQPRQLSSEVQWKYRGRTGSEVASCDPLPAPTGLDKQHSEGFQRFFKAVVSPTHVRVTAGGRIVPNTRNSASPTMKWGKEQQPTDTQDSVEPTKESKMEPAFPHANNQMSVPAPLLPTMYPPHPMVYQQMGIPMPYYHPMQMQNPMQHGFAYPYGFGTPNAQFPNAQFPNVQYPNPQFPNAQYLGLPEGPQRTEAREGEDKQAGGGGENDNLPKRGPIKISPPNQFDQSRPFYFNGQVVFPPMIASNGLPSGAMPPSAYPGPRMSPMASNYTGSNMAVAGSNAGSTFGSNGALPPSYPVVADQNAAHQQLLPSTDDATGGMPPLSSIRPSEITRKQLKGLKTSLKFYVSQLQFNRHQIDEPWVFAQAQKVRDHIKQFEQNLQRQLRYEREHYPNMEPTPKHITDGLMKTPSRPPSIKHAHASSSSQHGSMKSIGPVPGHKFFPPQQVGNTGNRPGPKLNRAAVGINSTKTDNSTAHIDAFEASLIKKLSAPGATKEQKAMLEAITRPLNPKHDPKPSATQQASDDNTSSKGYSAQPGPSGEKKHIQGQTPSSGASSQNQRRSGETAQSGGAYPVNRNALYIAPVNGNGLPMPYLVGNFPPGADPWTYQGHDFVYARELTDAEKQARHVYWGHLPIKGTGLPKFDGKDFYPPSPQKAAENAARIRNIPSGRPEIDFGFEVKRSEVDPFHSSRDADSIRSYESGRRVNKAIPIVAPPDADRKSTSTMPTMNKAKANEEAEEVGKLSESLQGCKLSSSEESSAKMSEKKKSPSLNRRAVERSSTKSGHDLWQNMLKKGSTSGNVLPGTISSTTATGYLPQYSGNAVASLGPTISNNSPSRISPTADDKLDGPRLTMEKIGENCPPSSAPSIEHDVTKDLHERMLRDAKRRGVIGSDWQ